MVGSVDETPTPLRPGCSIFRRRCAYAYERTAHLRPEHVPP